MPAALAAGLACGALAFVVLIVAEPVFARLALGRAAGAFLSGLLAPAGIKAVFSFPPRRTFPGRRG